MKDEGWATYCACKIMTSARSLTPKVIDFAPHHREPLRLIPGQINP